MPHHRNIWRALLSGFCLLTCACEGPTGPGRAPQSAPTTPGLIKVVTADQRFSVDVPADLQVHPMTGAVMGSTIDGAFRIYVAEIEVDTLLRLAGAGKETLLALGWRVDSEQHLEKAIQVSLVRGGTVKSPQEFRDVWWFLKDGSAYHCDGISTSDGKGRLGDDLRVLCQGVMKSASAQPVMDDPLSAP